MGGHDPIHNFLDMSFRTIGGNKKAYRRWKRQRERDNIRRQEKYTKDKLDNSRGYNETEASGSSGSESCRQEEDLQQSRPSTSQRFVSVPNNEIRGAQVPSALKSYNSGSLLGTQYQLTEPRNTSQLASAVRFGRTGPQISQPGGISSYLDKHQSQYRNGSLVQCVKLAPTPPSSPLEWRGSRSGVRVANGSQNVGSLLLPATHFPTQHVGTIGAPIGNMQRTILEGVVTPQEIVERERRRTRP